MVKRALSSDTHKSPTLEQVLSELAGGCIYGTIDLEEAYTQIPVDRETSHVLSVNTVEGLHSVTWLPFGIMTASYAFQRIIYGLLGPVKGVIAYQDNIYVKSLMESEYQARLLQVLHILGDAGFMINSDKCVWQAASIEDQVFKFDAEGIHPTIDKTAATTNANSAFFKYKAIILEPLHHLLDSKFKWSWTTKHQVTFQTVKYMLIRHQVLAHYNPDLLLVVTADSSLMGWCAQTGKTREIPIAYASRTLSATERAYSQLDREGLTIIFAVINFTPYLAFHQYTIITDHKPLLGIFEATDLCLLSP
ncbi:hypothetical protein PR048_011043 [Dryococelus australis]|uniref:Reverse transcriptase domain-containing protein n=1 Tax=Dryococelus australis TaxID=614101 RepID=A0ABQ9HKI7_9NEOP|nr:hypothetical protein PR048_011043 [Dryococelus australis]